LLPAKVRRKKIPFGKQHNERGEGLGKGDLPPQEKNPPHKHFPTIQSGNLGDAGKKKGALYTLGRTSNKGVCTAGKVNEREKRPVNVYLQKRVINRKGQIHQRKGGERPATEMEKEPTFSLRGRYD